MCQRRRRGSNKNGGPICRLSGKFRRLNRGPKAAIGGDLGGGRSPPSLNAGFWGAPVPQCEEKSLKYIPIYIYIYIYRYRYFLSINPLSNFNSRICKKSLVGVRISMFQLSTSTSNLASNIMPFASSGSSSVLVIENRSFFVYIYIYIVFYINSG